MNRPPVFTVAQVNRYIKRLMEGDALLSSLFVQGELSNVKRHTSGHLYFTLKDENAALGGVMFKGSLSRVPFTPQNGMRVIVGGAVSLYEKSGQYQIYAEYMEPAGIGGLQAAFLQLCDKLQAEGLFAPERKKPLPAFPACVAVVTSPTGAAVRDMIRILQGRNPTVKVVVAPALVQGPNAAADIARAIDEVNAWAEADVMIVGRGGGSMEDLWAFNEEITARAVARSRIPVISAVGHETDTTVVDFVADRRAPTPTAAAAMAVQDRVALWEAWQRLAHALHKSVHLKYEDKQAQWQRLRKSRCLQRPLEPLYERQRAVQDILQSLTEATLARLREGRASLEARTALLTKVSPYALWARGFHIARHESGGVVTSLQSLHIDDKIRLDFQDGEAEAVITGLKPGPHNGA